MPDKPPQARPTRDGARAKPPLRWTAVLFAFAATLLLVTVMDGLVRTMQLGPSFEALATLVAPFTAGVLTAFYAGTRGGMHAALGSLLSVPVLAIFIFNGVWVAAVLAGCFCILGGAITEILLRSRGAPSA